MDKKDRERIIRVHMYEILQTSVEVLELQQIV